MAHDRVDDDCVTTPGNTLDPALESLADAAEEGRPTPVIFLLTGAWLVRGHPVRAARFYEKTWAHWYGELDGSKEFRSFRGSAADREAAIRARLEPDFKALSSNAPTAGRVLTLSNGLVMTNVGGGFEMPVLRVPLSAVQGWWATTVEIIEPKAARGVGFGVGIPLDF